MRNAPRPPAPVIDADDIVHEVHPDGSKEFIKLVRNIEEEKAVNSMINL